MIAGVAWQTLARLRSSRTPLYLGALIFGLGGLLDIAYHVAPASDRARLLAWLGPDGVFAHEVTLAGMVLVVVSLVLAGVRRSEEHEEVTGTGKPHRGC